jgi:hypothetical protein
MARQDYASRRWILSGKHINQLDYCRANPNSLSDVESVLFIPLGNHLDLTRVLQEFSPCERLRHRLTREDAALA